MRVIATVHDRMKSKRGTKKQHKRKQSTHTHTPNGLDWERKLGDQSNGKHEHAEKHCEKKAKEKAEKPATKNVSE